MQELADGDRPHSPGHCSFAQNLSAAVGLHNIGSVSSQPWIEDGLLRSTPSHLNYWLQITSRRGHLSIVPLESPPGSNSSRSTVTQMVLVKFSGPENKTKDKNAGNGFVGKRFAEDREVERVICRDSTLWYNMAYLQTTHWAEFKKRGQESKEK